MGASGPRLRVPDQAETGSLAALHGRDRAGAGPAAQEQWARSGAAPVRLNEHGAATPLTLLLGLTLVVIPVMVLVLTLPAWEQRRVDAEDAARAAARALATASSWAGGRIAADNAVGEVAYNDGLSPDDISVTYSGDLVPGGTVTASVTVVIPAGEVPGLGSIGRLHYTASSTEHVDTYEESPS